MGLEDGWSDLAQQRDKWHATTEGGVKKWEKVKNAKEKEEYEQKKAGSGVKCTFRGCTFTAKNEKGLKSHWSQKHKYVEESSDDDGDEDDDDEDDGSDGSDDDGDEETDDEEDDSDTDEDDDSDTDEDAAPPRSSSSSCSSSSSAPPTAPTTTRSISKHVCLHCQKDCTNGPGLSSHLRHSAECQAAAADQKKEVR